MMSFQGLQSGGIHLQKPVQRAALITAKCPFLQTPSLTAPASCKARIYPAKERWLSHQFRREKIHYNASGLRLTSLYLSPLLPNRMNSNPQVFSACL